jgi:CheY-like chemotaxis protein
MASAMVKGRRPVGDRSETTDSTACAGSHARPVRFDGHLCALLAQPEGEEGRLLESALRGGGSDVIPAEDGVAALEVICAVGPDVIVADLDHHDLDGLVLCRVLRSLSAHAMLPVLVLTKAASEDARALAMAALGNVRVMRKPAVPVLVVAAVSEMVNIVPLVGRRASLPGLMAPPLVTVPRAALMGG